MYVFILLVRVCCIIINMKLKQLKSLSVFGISSDIDIG